MGDEEAEAPLWAVWRFFIHIITGIVIFTLVAFAALGLHYVVELLVTWGLPAELVKIFVVLEYMLLAADVILFAIFIFKTSLTAARDLWRNH